MNKSTQKNLPYIIGLIIFALVIIFAVKEFLVHPSASGSVQQQTVAGPVATQQVNKTYEFPITDDKGKVVSTLKYEIQSAELRNQILIKGEPATAVAGKEFLVVNLKITNNSDSNISMQTHDYVRLSTDNKKEWLSPDIHNDPVDISAISTKYTRLGYTIDSNTDKNLILQIGEIKGAKDYIQLHFN